MILAKFIKTKLEPYGGVKEIGDILGLDYPHVTKIKQGKREIRFDEAEKLAKHYKVTIDQIIEIDPEVLVAVSNGDIVKIPAFMTAAEAGSGTWIEGSQEPDYYTEWSRPFLEASIGIRANYDSLILCKISGHSMAPKYNDGDTVMVDTSVKSGDGVYVFTDLEGTKIKRLQFLHDKINVISDNLSYPSYPLGKDVTIFIHGRVIRILREAE